VGEPGVPTLFQRREFESRPVLVERPVRAGRRAGEVRGIVRQNEGLGTAAHRVMDGLHLAEREYGVRGEVLVGDELNFA
jgi:hypothetical protein